MFEHFLEYIPVFFLSMLKFANGPMIGVAAGLGVIETGVVTFLGSMTIITVLTIIGEPAKEWMANRQKRKDSYKLFNKKRRRSVRVYQKFDIKGIAILTPLFLTPIGGTIIAIAFGVKKSKILLHMLWTNFVWAFVLAYAFATIMDDVKAFFSNIFEYLFGLF